MTLEEQIGQKLKKLRIKAGFSSAEAYAYAHGLNRSQVQLYERGGSKLRVDTLVKVIKPLGISLSEFFKGIEID